MAVGLSESVPPNVVSMQKQCLIQKGSLGSPVLYLQLMLPGKPVNKQHSSYASLIVHRLEIDSKGS